MTSNPKKAEEKFSTGEKNGWVLSRKDGKEKNAFE